MIKKGQQFECIKAYKQWQRESAFEPLEGIKYLTAGDIGIVESKSSTGRWILRIERQILPAGPKNPHGDLISLSEQVLKKYFVESPGKYSFCPHCGKKLPY